MQQPNSQAGTVGRRVSVGLGSGVLVGWDVLVGLGFGVSVGLSPGVGLGATESHWKCHISLGGLTAPKTSSSLP